MPQYGNCVVVEVGDIKIFFFAGAKKDHDGQYDCKLLHGNELKSTTTGNAPSIKNTYKTPLWGIAADMGQPANVL